MTIKNKIHDMAWKGYGIEIYPVTPSDLPSLRRWRNNPRISQQMNDTSYITPHHQRLWFDSIKGRVDQAHWTVWSQGIRTGYLNIKGEGFLQFQKHLVGGYYVGDSAVRHGLLGYSVVMMQLDIVFEHLSALQFRGSILKSNRRARRLNQQFGYREEWKDGSLNDVVLIQSDYKEAKKKFLRYFNDPRCELIE